MVPETSSAKENGSQPVDNSIWRRERQKSGEKRLLVEPLVGCLPIYRYDFGTG